MITLKTAKLLIKCEEPGCHYEIKVKPEEIVKHHLNPCPNCGREHLVTDEDMEIFNEVFQ